MDGAPPFMQAYMKEAYMIVCHFLLFFDLCVLPVRSCNKLLR
jgi:hypothetical protein